MSFLLNYLDGALDSVTGRYDGEEGEEALSEKGSLAADVGDDAEGEVKQRVSSTAVDSYLQVVCGISTTW